jgi:predicted nuclease of predicted toxin-antitoxin system
LKFLVDQCLSPVLARLLSQAGHDVVHVRDRGMSSATDDEILALADDEGRVLISADSDFGEILTLAKDSHYAH